MRVLFISKQKQVEIRQRYRDGNLLNSPFSLPPLSFWGGMREVSRTKGITQILVEFSPIEKAPSLIDLRRPLLGHCGRLLVHWRPPET